MSVDVAGLGNALMDALAVVDDDHALASELGLVRGTMHLVDHAEWTAAYERVRRAHVTFDAGGSCANTVATVGRLGGSAVFCGQVGDDQMGHQYAAHMERANGAHALVFDPTRATGKCLSIISRQDAERTMLTDLGASIRLPHLPDAFTAALRTSSIAHFTGYELLDPGMRSLVFRGMGIAREAGARVSFDAADPFVVTGNRELTWEVLGRFVDIAFLNADEARSLTGEDPADAAARIAERAGLRLIVVKMGSQGSLLWHDGRVERVAARRVAAVDTTGAGDSYAGGFLYGLAHDWPPERCARLGAAVAALTVAQVGATVKDATQIAEALASVT